MAFKGWPAEGIEFFEGLEADNSKTYWQAHRASYDSHARGPMEALLEDLAPEFGAGRVFRPNRDVRFSADKSPYKTALGAMVGDSGYVQFSARGLAAGAGMWMMAPDQLDRYRRAVADDRRGTELVDIVAGLRRSGIEVSGHDMLKSAPRGYPKDHPRIDLLRHKGLIAWKEWEPGAWLGTARARTRVVEFLHAARPLVAWLDERVGPSELPADRRG